MKVKCSKCGYVGEADEFPKGRDFFQNEYIRDCPKKCGNHQTPGDASMRAFGGKRPFEYVREPEAGSPLDVTIHRANEAS